MKDSNRWRANGTFERQLMAEMENAAAVGRELSTIFEKGLVIPPVESTLDRLTEQAYEPIVGQIQNITRFHSGPILAQKVFNQMSDKSVSVLVEYMLMNQKRHVALTELHHSFDNQYWMGRFRSLKKTCPVWDVIDTPQEVGLLQFGQLLLRHRNILRRKSPVIILNAKMQECDSVDVGNRYILQISWPDDGGDSVQIIREIIRGESVYISDTLYSSNEVEKEFTLAEPFLIAHGGDFISAGFLPSLPNITIQHYKVPRDPQRKLGRIHPTMINSGNFKDATTRFYPFITEEHIDNTGMTSARLLFTFQFLKMSFADEMVSIDLAWKSDFSESPYIVMEIDDEEDDGHQTPARNIDLFCANREHAAFIMRDSEDSRTATIYLVPFENPKIKSIDVTFDIDFLYLVDGNIFVAGNLDDSDDDDGNEPTSLIKINFDAPEESGRIEELCTFEAFKCQGVFGQNLHFDTNSDESHQMMFLDRNITKNHQERITSCTTRVVSDKYMKHMDIESGYLGHDLVKCTSGHMNGSCLIDGMFACQLKVYMDEPTLLQSEIEQCISSTN